MMNYPDDRQNPAEDLLKCAHCGMCLPVCPVYRETLIETDSPRARLALLKDAEHVGLDRKKGHIQKIYDCITCMACSQVCPSGVRPDELISRARTQIRKKPLPLQKLIINGFLSHPARLRRLLLPLAVYEKSGARKLAKRTRLLNLFPKRWSRFESMLPELFGPPIYHGQEIVLRNAKQAKYTVGYFPGCAQNLVFTSVFRSTTRVLLKNECDIIVPGGVHCCGMPHMGYGEREEAKRMARQNIDACGSTLKNYTSLLEEDPDYKEKARAFSQKVRDITEFLLNDIAFNRDFNKLHLKATYHEPCHLGRGQNLKEAPRKVLREILGDNFIEMNEADSCCGGGGSYTVTHEKLSMKILDRKMNNLKESRAEVIVTACPGCEVQLAQGIMRSNQQVRLMHISELLAEAYDRLKVEE
jgi:glycolate oxidase iron-sulfur subunit